MYIERIDVHFVARVLESSISFPFPCFNLDELYLGEKSVELRELHALEHRLFVMVYRTLLLKTNLSWRLENSL